MLSPVGGAGRVRIAASNVASADEGVTLFVELTRPSELR